MTRRVLSGFVLAALAAGCHPRQPTRPEDRSGEQPTTAPAPTAAPAVAEFQSREKKVRVSYPSDWKPRAAPDDGFILWLVRSTSPAGTNAPAVSLEVPKLPAHIPGMIPLGSVVGGYVDDLKKQHPGLKVDPPVSTNVAGANARRVSSTWDEDGASLTEDAVLTVHGDRVYIFRANGRAGEMNDVRAVLQQVIDSVRWE
jgi:hypothetical protein